MICVIDACSYIYLNQSSFNIGGEDYTLFSLLNKLITIKQSETVSQEILKHFEKVTDPEDDIKRNNRSHNFRRPLKHYDDLLFNGTIRSSSNDAGEKANLTVCIDIFNYKNNSQIVFLSDDVKALKNESNFRGIYDAFPYFLIWNSLDVILFIYYADKNFTYDLAKQTLQDLIAFHRKPRRLGLEIQKDRGEIDYYTYRKNIRKLNKWQQNTKLSYIKRLEKISVIIKK